MKSTEMWENKCGYRGKVDIEMFNIQSLERIYDDIPILVDNLSLIRWQRLDLFSDIGLQFKNLENV
jgi:hypothetical protein